MRSLSLLLAQSLPCAALRTCQFWCAHCQAASLSLQRPLVSITPFATVQPRKKKDTIHPQNIAKLATVTCQVPFTAMLGYDYMCYASSASKNNISIRIQSFRSNKKVRIMRAPVRYHGRAETRQLTCSTYFRSTQRLCFQRWVSSEINLSKFKS
jgi:hypothetical protein